MNAPAVEMARHVALLCENNNILLRTYQGGGRAWTKVKLIQINPIRGPVSYFLALHEIGHLIGEGRSAPKLEMEANAWMWALENSMRPPTKSVRAKIRRSLHSYYDARGRGLRHNMKLPPDDHPFWSLLEHGFYARSYYGSRGIEIKEVA